VIVIRPANEEDLPRLLEIYNHAVLHTNATAQETPLTLDERREWYDAHSREGYPILVAATAAGEVVGWGSLSAFHPRSSYRYTAENSVYLDPAWRGQGIGKLLLEPLIDLARAKRLRAVMAWIDSENEASLRLHAGLGFEKVGHFREVIYKFERWLDVVVMELVLHEN